MAKAKFLKSSKELKSMKNYGESALNAAINGATTIGVMYGATNIQISKDATKDEKIKKWLGPVAMTLGYAMKATMEQVQAVEVGNGLIASGALLTMGNLIAPAHKAKLGLAGVSGFGAAQPSKGIDYNDLVKKVVEETETMKGLERNNYYSNESMGDVTSPYENSAVPVEDIF